MQQLLNDVTALVGDELTRANKQYGDSFNSLHEAYAVIKEELEEAQDEIDIVEDLLNEFWLFTKHDDASGCDNVAYKIRNTAIRGAAELIQVAAMAEKYACRGDIDIE